MQQIDLKELFDLLVRAVTALEQLASSVEDINKCGISVSPDGDADTSFPVTIYPAEE